MTYKLRVTISDEAAARLQAMMKAEVRGESNAVDALILRHLPAEEPKRAKAEKANG